MASIRLTERDVLILRWLSRIPFASAPQVGRRFGMTYRNVSRRLKQLAQAGYLSHERLFHGRPGVYLATAEGSAIAGVLPITSELDVRTFNHDLAVVDLLVDLELAHVEVEPGRSREALETQERARFPDLVVTLEGERWPGELISNGIVDELPAVLGAHAAARAPGVIVWAGSSTTANRAATLAKDLGLAVDVRQWELHEDAPGDPWAVPS